MRSPVRTIAIVGGGFCGTLLAVKLLRRPPPQPCRVVLIERGDEVGRGVAYRAAPDQQLLNVPSGRMSADAGDPLQFARFAQRRNAAYAAEQFVPRALYGEYLQDLLRQAAGDAAGRIGYEQLRAEVTALRAIGTSGPYLLSLSCQQQLLADDVILACGDPPPTDPACASGIAGHPGYTRDPHHGAAPVAEGQRLLLIGTGLTMADIAVTAAASSPGIEMHAISRHGLLPAVQSMASNPGAGSAAGDIEFMSYLAEGSISARRLLQAFRALLGDLAQAGGDWRDAVNAARAAAPALWQRMPGIERARFLRHLRVHWDVHRHRLPPAIGERLAGLRQAGQLQVHAGHVLRIEAVGGGLRVCWRPRGGAAVVELTVDRVSNCTGAYGRLTRTQDRLLQGLVANGLAVADPLGLGWRTAAHGALIDRQGRIASHLYYLGPMLRADHWEASAVGELRLHAQRLADTLLRINA